MELHYKVLHKPTGKFFGSIKQPDHTFTSVKNAKLSIVQRVKRNNWYVTQYNLRHPEETKRLDTEDNYEIHEYELVHKGVVNG